MRPVTLTSKISSGISDRPFESSAVTRFPPGYPGRRFGRSVTLSSRFSRKSWPVLPSVSNTRIETGLEGQRMPVMASGSGSAALAPERLAAIARPQNQSSPLACFDLRRHPKGILSDAVMESHPVGRKLGEAAGPVCYHSAIQGLDSDYPAASPPGYSCPIEHAQIACGV